MSPKLLHTAVVLTLVLAISWLFQSGTLNEFPQYIHSWAQCDRYALALGFIDNGGDFFHPQTYVMNNQFPGEFMIPRPGTVTSVDFPIHDYLVSWIMRLAHSTEPWCFRLYVMLYAIAGLYFLYRLCALFSRSLTRALCVVLFALSSPVFLYYEAGFLPTIPSLANAMIALYAYVYFLHTGKRRFFLFALFFITLAALARLPFAILLVAMICNELWYLLRYRRIQPFQLIGFAVALIAIAAYYRYNAFLREQYGSLFLNYILPANSLHELREFGREAWQRWGFDYFDAAGWLLFLLAALGAAYASFVRRVALHEQERKFLFLALILFGGCCLYYLLMSYQFVNHDYYFLDTFYLPLVCFFLFCVLRFPVLPLHAFLRPFLLVVFVPVLILAKGQLDARVALFGNKEQTTALNYRNGARLLDSLQVPKEAKILVVGTDGSNNAFILLQRKGYVIIEPEKEKIEKALKWDWDVVVTDDVTMISRMYKQYPEIIRQLQRLGGNGRLSVYRRPAHDLADATEASFFELEIKPVVYREQRLFEPSEPVPLPHVDVSAACLFDSLDPVREYGQPLVIRRPGIFRRPHSLLKVDCCLQSGQALQDLLVCVSLKVNGQETLFDAVDLAPKRQGEDWQKYTALFMLPSAAEGEAELHVFLWNKGKNYVRYNEFQVTIY